MENCEKGSFEFWYPYFKNEKNHEARCEKTVWKLFELKWGKNPFIKVLNVILNWASSKVYLQVKSWGWVTSDKHALLTLANIFIRLVMTDTLGEPRQTVLFRSFCRFVELMEDLFVKSSNLIYDLLDCTHEYNIDPKNLTTRILLQVQSTVTDWLSREPT